MMLYSQPQILSVRKIIFVISFLKQIHSVSANKISQHGNNVISRWHIEKPAGKQVIKKDRNENEDQTHQTGIGNNVAISDGGL